MKKNKPLNNPLFLAGIITTLVAAVTAQSLLSHSKSFIPGGIEYTGYNNYIIFKQSFFHLIHNKDLYQLYPAEHWDLYKYSPTFSLFMAPLAVLPDTFGLFIWNLLNALVLFFAIRKLPIQPDKKKLLAAGFILIELITALQNSQSNALIAGLIILAFLFLEKKQTALAVLCIVATVFIKIFGLVAFTIFIFYTDKLKAFLYTIGITLLLAALPLTISSFPQLSLQYQSWFHLLQNDHSASIGISVAGIIDSWFGINAKSIVLVTGAVLLCIPLLKYKFFNDRTFKLFFLSSLLIWIVIFNHKAESPTFIIAVSGIAIWFFCQEIKLENLILLIFAFILTILSQTDIFPKSIRLNYVVPYALKALPCILIWLKITADLLLYKQKKYKCPAIVCSKYKNELAS